MPVLNVIDENDSIRKLDSYIYIQNLPWSACQSDIRKFFDDYQIVEGGVLIHGSLAFVAVDADTAWDALNKNGQSICGQQVQLSIVDRCDLKKILLANVRRTLDFSNAVGNPGRIRSIVHKRKIRPTCVNSIRNANSKAAFSVSEVEPIPKECGFEPVTKECRSMERSLFCESRETKRSKNGRKIHPTTLNNECQWDKIPAFHPEECYIHKKIKLEGSSRNDE